MILSSMAASAQSSYQGNDPMGTLSYALPKSTLSFDVTAECERFYAGPYAKFAAKYLGIQAKEADKTTYTITNVKMTPYMEADQTRRFLITPGNGANAFLKLTAQGLVSVNDGNFGAGSQWRFPAPNEQNFNDKGVSSNLTSESTTLYKKSALNTVAVQQNMVVEKSVDQKAKEAADMIFSLREKRVQIVTGDTDATFSGEAMSSAIKEIEKLEKDYMSMFIGYTEKTVQQMKFDVVPDKDNAKQMYIAFRIADDKGLVTAENISGKPYVLEIVPDKSSESVGEAKPAKSDKIAVYRIPAICTVRLSDGVNVLLQDRVPIYQLGMESTFALSTK